MSDVPTVPMPAAHEPKPAHSGRHVEFPPPSAQLRIDYTGGEWFLSWGKTNFPIGPWWLLIITALLSPIVAAGGIFWLTGRVIQWRCGKKGHIPIDARILKWLGRQFFKLLWVAPLLYLSLVEPDIYRAWRKAGKAES